MITVQKRNTKEVNPNDLWDEIREGNKDALSDLYRFYRSYLFNWGYKIVPQRGFVKDAIQELFLVLWMKRDQLGSAYSVKSYLFHSLRRIMLRNLTKQKNRADRNKVYTDDALEEEKNVEELRINHELQQHKRQCLNRAIEQLSARQKEVIFLKFYEGLSSSEISEIMGIHQQSVYNHVSNAIRNMQDYIR